MPLITKVESPEKLTAQHLAPIILKVTFGLDWEGFDYKQQAIDESQRILDQMVADKVLGY